MKLLFIYLTLFFFSSGYANSFEFDITKDSLKTLDEKYDSLKYSFLPKYEIYGRYFNPFQINNTGIYAFDFGFKWHTKKIRYLKTHFLTSGIIGAHNVQILSFSQMFRLTISKIDWIHLELAYGIGISHYFISTPWYETDYFGFGPIINGEMQFDVGNRSNISLGAYFSSQFSYSFHEQTDFTVPWLLPTNNTGFLFYTSFQPVVYVGFNFYIK